MRCVSRRYCERVRQLDIRTLQRQRSLSPSTTTIIEWQMGGAVHLQAEFERIRLRYRLDGQPIEQRINLAETRVRYGRRAWFGCPSCGRRCAKLFLRARFACRICAKVYYECQSATPQRRVELRFLKLRQRLQDVYGEIRRPKWMRRARFKVMRDEVSRLEYLAGYTLMIDETNNNDGDAR